MQVKHMYGKQIAKRIPNRSSKHLGHEHIIPESRKNSTFSRN